MEQATVIVLIFDLEAIKVEIKGWKECAGCVLKTGKECADLELWSSDEGTAHEHTENSKADSVVSLFLMWPAGVSWEGCRVVQCNAHKEHSQTPAQGPKHPLPPIMICFVSKICQNLEK